jgi:DNA-binding transcriptional LysR family regulator
VLFRSQDFLVERTRAIGRSPRRPRVQVTSFEALCRMAEAGVGIAVVPRSAALRHGRTMALAIVPLRDDWAPRQRRVVVRDAQAAPAYVQDLIEAVCAYRASVEPG